jgi:hypothetical protein
VGCLLRTRHKFEILGTVRPPQSTYRSEKDKTRRVSEVVANGFRYHTSISNDRRMKSDLEHSATDASMGNVARNSKGLSFEELAPRGQCK